MVADSDAILITLIQQTISIFGIIFNLAIVWITIKNKNLHNSYGYLLAIYSFCEALAESSTFLPTVLTLIDTKIPLLTCFYVSVFQTLFAGSNANFLMLFISVDRLMAIISPVFYRFVIRAGAGKLVLACNMITSTYLAILIYFDWLYILGNQHIMVYCNPGDQFGGAILNWAFGNGLIANIFTTIIYIVLGIYLKFSQTTNTQMAQQNRRVYKTLAIVTFVIFFLYFVGACLTLLLTPILANGDAKMEFLYFRIFAQLNTLAGAFNAPVLYFCSTEYRNTMNRQFPFILTILKVCRIVPVNNNNNCQIAVPSAITIQQPAAAIIIQNQ